MQPTQRGVLTLRGSSRCSKALYVSLGHLRLGTHVVLCVANWRIRRTRCHASRMSILLTHPSWSVIEGFDKVRCLWIYSCCCARPSQGFKTVVTGSTAAAAPDPKRVDKRPLVLQPQLRQAPIGRTECHWFYGVELVVLHRARPLEGVNNHLWFYSRSCARPP
jgi:hypothetical protein